MSLSDRYLAYAEEFEHALAKDDWARLEPYFTEDAAYRPDGTPNSEVAGRAAMIERLKGGVDQFDKLMDSRNLSFEKPEENGDQVTIRWKGTYTKAGLPDVVISGSETATFDGDRIRLLSDTFDPEAQKGIEAWLAEHGAKLAE